MNLSMSRLPYILFALFAGLLAIALVRHYSSVPYWDMWDGYLDFYNRILDGDLTAWWYQHNEHRIVLSRLLFWMDIAWFGGKSAFLIVVNFLLAVSAALLMAGIFREMFREQRYGKSHWLLFTLCLTMPLSWMQEENLSWAFQSQFFLAHILPLAAFVCFYLSEKTQNWRWFLASLFLGIASVGAMANGVAVLPILAVLSIFASDSPTKKSLAYGLTAGSMLLLYFSDYRSPPGHGSLAETISQHPWEMLKYIALYVGSPLHFLLENVTPKTWETAVLNLSMVSGFALMLGSAAILLSVLQCPRKRLLEIALLGFIAYIGATAFGAAGGRLMFGLEQALAGRYRTPAILLWLCFLILVLKLYPSKGMLKSNTAQALAISCLSATLLFAAFAQIRGAVSNNESTTFERNAAILSIALGVKDVGQIRHVYPSAERAIKIAETSLLNNISIFFQDGVYANLEKTLISSHIAEKEFRSGEVPRCPGALDKLSGIEDDPTYIKITGWLYKNDVPENSPVSVSTSGGELIGYLIRGKERGDVAAIVSEEARYSGYYAYLLSGKANESNRVFVNTNTSSCWFPIANDPSN